MKQPARKLRKSLKSLPSDLPIDFVHRLRTQTGRLEAIVAASVLERKKLARQLLKTIRPVRKAAGEVRDMDVLTAKARTLSGRRNDSVARLVEHLIDTPRPERSYPASNACQATEESSSQSQGLLEADRAEVQRKEFRTKSRTRPQLVEARCDFEIGGRAEPMARAKRGKPP